MRHGMGAPLVLALLLFAQAELWAQGKGGGIGGGVGGGKGNGVGNGTGPGTGVPNLPNEKDYSREGCDWVDPPSRAADAAKSDEKYLLVFAYEDKANGNLIPTDFFLLDVIQLSKTTWVFTKIPFSKENADLRKFGIKKPGTVVGLDRFGNEWKRIEAVSPIELKGLLSAVPLLVKKFTEKLQADFARADGLAKTDVDKAGRLFGEIARLPRKGYKEIEDAGAKVREICERQLKAAELAFSVNEQQGVGLLKQLVQDYKDLPAGTQADLRLAEFERSKGQFPPAIERVKKALRMEGAEAYAAELDRARSLLERIVADGQERIRSAKETGATDRAKAAGLLRDIARQFGGTEASKAASEAAKAFE